ncbi:MAG: aspartate--tRNA(Asn) ligase [Halobacteria archaeon]
MTPTHASDQVTPELEGKRVTVAGWAEETRDMGGLLFLVLRDGHGKVQVTLAKKRVDASLFDAARAVPRESVVEVTGTVRREPKAPGGCELQPDSLRVVSAARSPLPLDPSEKVPAELDTRLDARFLDLRRPAVQAIFRLRSELLQTLRALFAERGFVEIYTPKILAAAAEGGAALFPVAYFEQEAFLAQSPQLYKQSIMATGLDRVFEIGPIFRAEEHDTRKHLNEAVSIDVECAWMDDAQVMDLAEEVVAACYARAAGSRWLKPLQTELKVPKRPFRRLTYREAVSLIPDHARFGEDLSTAAEKALGDRIGAPYFITDWPARLKPYYTQPGSDPALCKGFDLMHPRMELASGGQRVHDPDLLEKRIREQGLSPERFEFYLRAFRYGMPPHAGWGMGLDRLMACIVGAENIREVVLFPRDRKRLVP